MCRYGSLRNRAVQEHAQRFETHPLAFRSVRSRPGDGSIVLFSRQMGGQITQDEVAPGKKMLIDVRRMMPQ